MKQLITLIMFLFLLSSFAQQIKLTPQVLSNGLKYPVVHLPMNINAQDKINIKIEEQIAALKVSDFCVGDYGYVQKGMHMQIHMLCNCIEMSTSEHYYLLFNLENGEIVSASNLFDDKQVTSALKYIHKRLSDFQALGDKCKTAYAVLGIEPSWEQMNIRLVPEGIEVRPIHSTDCEKNALRIEWKELHSLLRYNFI